MKTNVTRYSRPVAGLILLLACSLLCKRLHPRGWFVAGSKPASYEAGTDAQAAYNGHPSAYLKSEQPCTDGFGALMQEFRAEKYAGKRLRFSAFPKSDAVQDSAGLWMRVDKGRESVAFDNMQDRPIIRNYQLAELSGGA